MLLSLLPSYPAHVCDEVNGKTRIHWGGVSKESSGGAQYTSDQHDHRSGVDRISGFPRRAPASRVPFVSASQYFPIDSKVVVVVVVQSCSDGLAAWAKPSRTTDRTIRTIPR